MTTTINNQARKAQTFSQTIHHLAGLGFTLIFENSLIIIVCMALIIEFPINGISLFHEICVVAIPVLYTITILSNLDDNIEFNNSTVIATFIMIPLTIITIYYLYSNSTELFLHAGIWLNHSIHNIYNQIIGHEPSNYEVINSTITDYAKQLYIHFQ